MVRVYGQQFTVVLMRLADAKRREDGLSYSSMGADLGIDSGNLQRAMTGANPPSATIINLIWEWLECDFITDKP